VEFVASPTVAHATFARSAEPAAPND